MECERIQKSKATGAVKNSARASAGLPRALAIGNGGKSNADCIMPEVNPPADVPGANLVRVGKRLQPGRKLTDAKIPPVTGNVNCAFVQCRHPAGPLCVRPWAHGSRAPKIRNLEVTRPGGTASIQSVPHPGTSHGRCGRSGGAMIGSSRAGTASAIGVAPPGDRHHHRCWSAGWRWTNS